MILSTEVGTPIVRHKKGMSIHDEHSWDTITVEQVCHYDSERDTPDIGILWGPTGNYAKVITQVSTIMDSWYNVGRSNWCCVKIEDKEYDYACFVPSRTNLILT